MKIKLIKSLTHPPTQANIPSNEHTYTRRNEMTTLKTNWAIRTTDEQFKAYIGTLKALGYEIYSPTLLSESTEGCDFLTMNGVVARCGTPSSSRTHFPDISSFLVYHFSSEKTEAEKELEALQEKMNSLQEQIDRVKLSITK